MCKNTCPKYVNYDFMTLTATMDKNGLKSNYISVVLSIILDKEVGCFIVDLNWLKVVQNCR